MLHSGDIAAKLLSGKKLTSHKSTFSWGCRSPHACYVVAKPTDSVKQPLNCRMTVHSGHGDGRAVETAALTFAAVGMELKVQIGGI
jgi:hypothetical protein